MATNKNVKSVSWSCTSSMCIKQGFFYCLLRPTFRHLPHFHSDRPAGGDTRVALPFHAITTYHENIVPNGSLNHLIWTLRAHYADVEQAKTTNLR